MSGEKDISKLLTEMSPSMNESEFVFLSFPESNYCDHAELEPIASIKEKEGLTLIVPRHIADEKEIEYASSFRMITLNVHSSLEAVGLTADISTELKEKQISANVIAGFYHDHIFVQSSLAEKAISALEALTQKGANQSR